MSNYTDGLPEIFRPSVEAAKGNPSVSPQLNFQERLQQAIENRDLVSDDPRVLLGDNLPVTLRNLIEARKGIEAMPSSSGSTLDLITGKRPLGSPAAGSTDVEPISLEPSNYQPTASTPPLATESGPTAPGFDPGNTTTQLGGLASVLKDYLGGQQGYLNKITDPQYLEAQSALRQRELANATRLIADAQMGQMKEKTRRDTIDAWRQITSDQIRAQTALAQGLMEAAYRSATPNAATIQALAPLSQQAMSVFKPGTSVI